MFPLYCTDCSPLWLISGLPVSVSPGSMSGGSPSASVSLTGMSGGLSVRASSGGMSGGGLSASVSSGSIHEWWCISECELRQHEWWPAGGPSASASSSDMGGGGPSASASSGNTSGGALASASSGNRSASASARASGGREEAGSGSVRAGVNFVTGGVSQRTQGPAGRWNQRCQKRGKRQLAGPGRPQWGGRAGSRSTVACRPFGWVPWTWRAPKLKTTRAGRPRRTRRFGGPARVGPPW